MFDKYSVMDQKLTLNYINNYIDDAYEDKDSHEDTHEHNICNQRNNEEDMYMKNEYKEYSTTDQKLTLDYIKNYVDDVYGDKDSHKDIHDHNTCNKHNYEEDMYIRNEYKEYTAMDEKLTLNYINSVFDGESDHKNENRCTSGKDIYERNAHTKCDDLKDIYIKNEDGVPIKIEIDVPHHLVMANFDHSKGIVYITHRGDDLIGNGLLRDKHTNELKEITLEGNFYSSHMKVFEQDCHGQQHLLFDVNNNSWGALPYVDTHAHKHIYLFGERYDSGDPQKDMVVELFQIDHSSDLVI